VTGLAERAVIELACKPHPDPAPGERDVTAVIQISGCLSSLSVSAYLSLLALDVEGVRVRLDACADCPLRIVQPAIEATIAEADAIICAGKVTGQVRRAEAGSRWSQRRRPVYSVKNPPVSRRGFFRMVTLQTENALKELSNPSSDSAMGATRERQRLILALAQLNNLHQDEAVPGANFTQLQADDTCTACGLCARVCPTGALQLNKIEDSFQLDFQAAACTNCGLCLTYCDPGALRREGQPAFRQILSGERQTLVRGSLRRCRKCSAAFSGDQDTAMCPLCAAHHAQPFSRVIPPAVMKRLPEDVQKKLRAAAGAHSESTNPSQ
jgi:ferredoxin